MKKILSFLAAISITSTSTPLVVNCNNFKPMDINKIITKHDLGTIKMSNEREILKAINQEKKSFNFQLKDLEIEIIKPTGLDKQFRANIKGKNRYFGQIQVSYVIHDYLSDLKNLNTEAQTYQQQELKKDDLWFNLNYYLGLAEGMIKFNPSVIQYDLVMNALFNLQNAMDESKNGGYKEADKSMLKANLDVARSIALTNKDVSYITIFQQAISDAQTVYDNPNLTINDQRTVIDLETNKLWMAIFTFIQTPNKLSGQNLQQPMIEENEEMGAMKIFGLLEDENFDDKPILQGEQMASTNQQNQLSESVRLNNLILQAQAIGQGNKAINAYATLKKAIGYAEGIASVYTSEHENPISLTTVIVDLQKAIDDFAKTNDLKANKDNLTLLKTQINGILGLNHFRTDNAVATLNSALNKIEEIQGQDLGISQQDIVDQTVIAVRNIIIAFYAQPLKEADYSKLDELIEEAQDLLSDNNKEIEITQRLANQLAKANHIKTLNLKANEQEQIELVEIELSKTIEQFEIEPIRV
ncbi:lipoprotein [Williamsoniiplasma lucivorax]|uniref:Uncharacterized protein n=1 Tax=Williamsoniiplasma lucivorax TaxID=209274 RepID=A0A2S5RFD4_9MOLU|nr:lipoprotein [Williamsoniiplasma lucivorax]PPE06021.1 hypothetical protein ELUCI_v1c03120 [Williamsoniiplasma lucivorax]